MFLLTPLESRTGPGDIYIGGHKCYIHTVCSTCVLQCKNQCVCDQSIISALEIFALMLCAAQITSHVVYNVTEGCATYNEQCLHQGEFKQTASTICS